MAQYKIYDGENWIDAAVQGQTGPVGPYYKPVLDDEYNLSMVPETVTGTLETINLGNIQGERGLTGYGFNTNLFDNWDFTHAIKRGSSDSNYICDRWYRNNEYVDFTIDNIGLHINSGTNSAFIKQSFPYISPGKYVISVISGAMTKQAFSFSVVSASGQEYSAEMQDPYECIQTGLEDKRVHYGIVDISTELISSNNNYPYVKICPQGGGSHFIIYRAKFEVHKPREDEQNAPTIEYDVYQNSSYNNFVIASSDKNGVYTSPFLSNTVTIEKEAWTGEESAAFFYATTNPVTDAIGNCHIIVAAGPDSAEDFVDNGIICSGHNNNNGVLTFRASSIPDKAIEANILVVRY